MSAQRVGLFGYGSLVNRQTLRQYAKMASNVQVRGWRRAWQHCMDTSLGKVCALTITQEVSARVTGAIIFENLDQLKALDEREIGYRRIPLSNKDISCSSPSVNRLDLFTYTSDGSALRVGSREYPIWRSYLECVVAGFLEMGGPPAISEFFDTTQGWNVPILDDRDAPKYIRSVPISATVRQEVNDLILAHGLEQFSKPKQAQQEIPVAQTDLA